MADVPWPRLEQGTLLYCFDSRIEIPAQRKLCRRPSQRRRIRQVSHKSPEGCRENKMPPTGGAQRLTRSIDKGAVRKGGSCKILHQGLGNCGVQSSEANN